MALKKRNLGDLRSELQTRLGFGSAGASAGVNAPIIESFLRDAQVQLYWAQDWKKLEVRTLLHVPAGATLLPYPVDAQGVDLIHPERFLWLSVDLNDPTPWAASTDYAANAVVRPSAPNGFRYECTTAGTSDTTEPNWPTVAGQTVVDGTVTWTCRTLTGSSWQEVRPGIEPLHYNTRHLPGPPCRYEVLADGIEIWPEADKPYTMRACGIAPLGRFTEPEDTPTLDDGPVFTLALALGKNHYRHPDAPVIADVFNALLGRVKSKSHTKTVYNPRDPVARPWDRPRVVGRDV